MPNRHSMFPLTVGMVMLLTVPGRAENWPGFRGAGGQGISQEKNLPLTWSLSEDLAWRIDIPGIGWSSPIVWEGRVVVTSATPDGRSGHVLCIDAADGKLVWDKEVVGQAPSPANWPRTPMRPRHR